MQRCPECGSENPDSESACSECGAGLRPTEGAAAAPSEGVAEDPAADDAFDLTAGDLDPDAERERFERRYGIDIGERTVSEYLEYLDRQDYSATPWFWSIVVVELAGIALFSLTVFADVSLFVEEAVLFTAASVLLAIGILADTHVVGQFGRWTKIRWTYVLFAAIPLVGHLTGALYLALRRLLHEQTVEHRKRLLNAGVDIGAVSDD